MNRYLLFLSMLLCLAPVAEQAEANTFPQRIVSLGPINTENVYLLGAEDRLVADTNYCVRPEAARSKEKIGSVMQVSIEKILSLRPDLNLATGLTQPQQLKKLRELGLRVEQF
ncbi:MAG: ABC transporter substrate-binding protein, partial [Candidatus Electrothrix sp. LOE2]|nr:ABC transporter substrate-binding protein [Candidatus Electrothrix sp. LOE2]